MRERRWRLAVELSILLHLVIAWLGPRGNAIFASLVPAPPPAAVQQDDPIRFELVDLPSQKEEEPARPHAPASDLSRRAHGGEGTPSDRPGVKGTTAELRAAPAAPPRQVPQPNPPRSQTEPRRETPQREMQTPAEEGLSAVVTTPPSPAQPKTVLRGLSPATVPPPDAGAAPDRTGGNVDLGPLSFDTQWYNWGPYAAEMLRRIKYHWQIPEIARLGVGGVTRIRFFIEKDGTVSGLEVKGESGHPPMDFAARDAILNASPLPPLPKDLGGVDREGVTITFYYNVRPPDQE